MVSTYPIGPLTRAQEALEVASSIRGGLEAADFIELAILALDQAFIKQRELRAIVAILEPYCPITKENW